MAKVELGLGECKDTLATGIEKLQNVVDTTVGLSQEDKDKYIKAIETMQQARTILSGVPCDQPAMTFDIGPYQPPQAS